MKSVLCLYVFVYGLPLQLSEDINTDLYHRATFKIDYTVCVLQRQFLKRTTWVKKGHWSYNFHSFLNKLPSLVNVSCQIQVCSQLFRRSIHSKGNYNCLLLLVGIEKKKTAQSKLTAKTWLDTAKKKKTTLGSTSLLGPLLVS